MKFILFFFIKIWENIDYIRFGGLSILLGVIILVFILWLVIDFDIIECRW